jgi:hypothetical protein
MTRDRLAALAVLIEWPTFRVSFMLIPPHTMRPTTLTLGSSTINDARGQ